MPFKKHLSLCSWIALILSLCANKQSLYFILSERSFLKKKKKEKKVCTTSNLQWIPKCIWFPSPPSHYWLFLFSTSSSDSWALTDLPFPGLSAESSALTQVHAWVPLTPLLFPILTSLPVTSGEVQEERSRIQRGDVLWPGLRKNLGLASIMGKG